MDDTSTPTPKTTTALHRASGQHGFSTPQGPQTTVGVDTQNPQNPQLDTSPSDNFTPTIPSETYPNNPDLDGRAMRHGGGAP